MSIDYTPYFKKYEELRDQVDAVFAKVQQEYPECVKCKKECADCCHALFDLTLIEAIYINHQINKTVPNEKKAELFELSNKADRAIYKIKKKAFNQFQDGESEESILNELAKERVPCPLLNSEHCCRLYELRPITCRLYGIPTSIGGKGHTCGFSEFKAGETYPTVNIDLIQSKLLDISQEMVKGMKSKYIKMGEMLVPLSMAILTSYNEEYLGIEGIETKKNEERK